MALLETAGSLLHNKLVSARDLQSLSEEDFTKTLVQIACALNQDQYAEAAAALELTSGTTRFKTIQKLVSNKDQSHAFLLYAINTETPLTASAIIWELQKNPQTWASPLFMAALAAPDEDVCLWALTSLARIEAGEAISAIQARLNRPASATVTAGQNLQKQLIKQDHSGVLPLLFVAPYLEKFGTAEAAEILLNLALTGVRADLSLSALKNILTKHAQDVTQETLQKIAALSPIANHDFLYVNDDPDDLNTQLMQTGICPTEEIARIAKQELDRHQ